MFNKPPSDIRKALLAAAGVKRDAINEDFVRRGQQMMSQAQGILASDPNLMQEVQTYVRGGPIRGDNYENEFVGVPNPTGRFGGQRFGGQRFGAQAGVKPYRTGSEEDAQGRGIMSAAANIRGSMRDAARRRYQELSQQRPSDLKMQATPIEERGPLNLKRIEIDTELDLLRNNSYAPGMEARESIDVDEVLDVPASSRRIPTDPRELGVDPGQTPDEEFSGLPGDMDSILGGDTGEEDFPEDTGEGEQVLGGDTGKEDYPDDIAKELGQKVKNKPTSQEAKQLGASQVKKAIKDPDTVVSENNYEDMIKDLMKLPPSTAGNIVLEGFGKGQSEDLKTRIKRYKDIAQDLFGKDIEGDKTEDAYNLAFLGFAIAAGDSPNALTNISKGLMAATKKFNDSAERRKQRKQKINELALTEALKDERSQKDFFQKRQLQKEKFGQRLAELGITEQSKNKRVVFSVFAERDNLQSKIRSNERIAKAKNTSAEKRAELERENRLLAAKIRNLPKKYIAFERYAEKAGRDISGDKYDTELKKFVARFGNILDDQGKPATGSTIATVLTDPKRIKMIKDTLKREKARELGVDRSKVPDPTMDQIQARLAEIARFSKNTNNQSAPKVSFKVE